MTLRRALLASCAAPLVLAAQPALAVPTSVQWGVDRTTTPWTLCVYDGSNTCQTELLGTPDIPAPSIGGLAALRSLPAGIVNNVVRAYYTTAGDAPPLTYVWKATCPGTADNLALYVAPNAGGTGCWSAAADPNRFDTREWGAVNDSTALTCGTDNAAAFQAAVNALGAGALIYNAGPSCVRSQINISQPGQRIACLGGGNAGGLHDVGTEFTAPAPIVWGGSSGGTMFRYQSATTQAANGWGADCALNGLGAAAYGVNSFSSRGGVWNIYGAHFTSSIFRADIDLTLGEANGNSYNSYTLFVDQSAPADGAAFQCFGTTNWDCSQDRFTLVTGNWNGRIPAVDFDNSDTEHVDHVSLFNNGEGGGTACGIRFRAGVSWAQTARDNFVDYVGISSAGGNACPVYAEGTEAGGGRNTASNWNSIGAIDTATGGSNAPDIGTPGGSLPGGAAISANQMLWWGTNAAPPGFNYFTQAGNNFSQRTAAGIITNRGHTGTITHGSFVDVTFSASWAYSPALAGTQLEIPTLCLSVSAIPNFAVSWHYACTPGSPTTVRFFNDSSTTDADFLYEVTGY